MRKILSLKYLTTLFINFILFSPTSFAGTILDLIRNNPPLIVATKSSDKTCVAEILENNAYAPSTEERDENGNTALHIAARKGDAEIVALLLDFKADLNAKNSDDLTPLQYLLKHSQAFSEEVDVNQASQESIAFRLISGGAGLNERMAKGSSLLDYIIEKIDESSCSRKDHRLLAKLCEALLKAGFAIDRSLKNGETLLHYAVKHGDEILAATLITLGADPNALDRNDKPPLAWMKELNLPIIKAFIRARADLNKPGIDLLARCASERHWDIARLLILHGSKLSRGFPCLNQLALGIEETKNKIRGAYAKNDVGELEKLLSDENTALCVDGVLSNMNCSELTENFYGPRAEITKLLKSYSIFRESHMKSARK